MSLLLRMFHSVFSLLEVIQANPLNALEGQKAASLRNVRSTLLRLLDTPMDNMSDILNVLLAQKINEKGVSDLQIVTESLESFSRKYKGESDHTIASFTHHWFSVRYLLLFPRPYCRQVFLFYILIIIYFIAPNTVWIMTLHLSLRYYSENLVSCDGAFEF